MKNMIITRATDILTKFILLLNNMWEKTIFAVFNSTRKYMESAVMPVKISHLWKKVMNV